MKSKRILPFLAALLAIGVAWYISANYYQLMMIQGDSMLPSYHNMQLVILDKHSENYDYGDVIAFQCDGLDSVLVKRIVARPSDTVVIEDGTLFVNGRKSTIFSTEGAFDYSGMAEEALELGEDCYFVIGDNIPESKDSRYAEVGCVKKTDIVGEVLK